MTFIADFHAHSRFSRACSKRLTLPNNAAWARLKGIDLLTTADFTHPLWFRELSEQLEEVDTGIYKLKKEFEDEAEILVPESCNKEMRFIFTTELSLIYKRGGKVRKVHHVVMAPNIDTVVEINRVLGASFNLKADGRPILGLDSVELLKILMNISEDIQIIPAHVWTPWFAIFGSKSGFDSVEECFGEYSDHICVLETGLSSDPEMNHRLSRNDDYVFVSNSDAHSPEKFGREATIFDCKMDYPSILNALRTKSKEIVGTIEFFPEEGKYHCDGLRAENLCLEPEETKKLGFVSPNTGKKITVGVLHRIDELADHPKGRKSPNWRDVWYIIPLQEIVSEITGVGVNSKTVRTKYFSTIEALGSEFYILKDCPIEKIKGVDPLIGEAIKRMREGNVIVKPGYDGEFGVIKLFKEGELELLKQKNVQLSLV